MHDVQAKGRKDAARIADLSLWPRDLTPADERTHTGR